MSGRVVAMAPIIAERATHASRNGQAFGSVMRPAASTAPAVTWLRPKGDGPLLRDPGADCEPVRNSGERNQRAFQTRPDGASISC